MFKCQVLSALSFMFRHYCFMFGLPSRRHSHVDGMYTGAHAREQRPGPRSRVGARIERLKLIRVYDRRIKPSIYRVSREDRQLMCRSRALRSAIVAFAESISVFIPCEIADDRGTTTTTTTTMTLCPFVGEYDATLPRESARNRALVYERIVHN